MHELLSLMHLSDSSLGSFQYFSTRAKWRLQEEPGTAGGLVWGRRQRNAVLKCAQQFHPKSCSPTQKGPGQEVGLRADSLSTHPHPKSLRSRPSLFHGAMSVKGSVHIPATDLPGLLQTSSKELALDLALDSRHKLEWAEVFVTERVQKIKGSAKYIKIAGKGI